MWITRILPRLLRVIPTFYAFSGHDSDLDFGRRHKVLGTFSSSSMDSGILHFPRSQRRDREGWREGGEWLDCNVSYTQKECAHTHVTKYLVDWLIHAHNHHTHSYWDSDSWTYAKVNANRSAANSMSKCMQRQESESIYRYGFLPLHTEGGHIALNTIQWTE